MSGPLAKRICELLEEFDGLSVLALSEQMRRNKSVVAESIRGMAGKLIYIDRWESAGANKRWAAVWCNVPVPKDCPKPELKRSDL